MRASCCTGGVRRSSSGGDVRATPRVRHSHSTGSALSRPIVVGYEWVKDNIMKYKSFLTSASCFVLVCILAFVLVLILVLVLVCFRLCAKKIKLCYKVCYKFYYKQILLPTKSVTNSVWG